MEKFRFTETISFYRQKIPKDFSVILRKYVIILFLNFLVKDGGRLHFSSFFGLGKILFLFNAFKHVKNSRTFEN